MMKKYKLLLPILLLSTGFVLSQTPAPRNFETNQDRESTANGQMLALKEGTLVVRLNTNTRKIAAIKKSIAAASTSNDRQRLEAMLEKTEQKTRNTNLWLKHAFDSVYSFTPVLFMPDTMSTKLKSGVREGIFLDAEQKIDPSIKLRGSFFVAYYGENSSDEKTNVEGITVLDSNLNELESPFPYFTGRTSIRRMFDAIFNKMTDKEHLVVLVSKFQKKLMAY